MSGLEHDLLRAERPALPLALVGFSLGAFVQSKVARALADRGTPAWRVCLAGMPSGEVEGECRNSMVGVSPSRAGMAPCAETGDRVSQ